MKGIMRSVWVILMLAAALLSGTARAQQGRGDRAARSTPGEPRAGDPLAGLREVRRLIVEGRYGKAEARLARVKRLPGVAPVDVLSLQGLIDLQLGRYRRAAGRFREVLALRATKVAVWLYLGQARYSLKDYRGALEALRRGEKVGQKMAGYWVLRGRCLLKLKRPHEAYLTFAAALQRFPGDRQLQREHVLALVELKLFSTALGQGRQYLRRVPDDPAGYLLLGEALRRAGDLQGAARILEQGRLRFADDLQILVRLAYTYAGKGMPVTAARLFERASLRDPAQAHAAAEQYRLGRRFRDALRLNGRVTDRERKLRQRLALLVAAGRWQLAATLDRDLRAAGALDDAGRYLLAYAKLRAGSLAEADALAAAIRDPAYAASAGRLRRSVVRCKKTPWQCK